MDIWTIATIIVLFFAWLWGWFLVFYIAFNKKQQTLDNKLETIDEYKQKILQDAEKKADEVVEKAKTEAKEKISAVEQLEGKLLKREEKIEEKIEKLEEEKELLLKDRQKLEEKKNEHQKLLGQIAQLDASQAKEELFRQVKEEYEGDLENFINKYRIIKQEEAEKEAAKIISKVMYRIGINQVNEFTLSHITIESEDMKGKIIWKWWRNIAYFERLTGVELIVDDTPWVVKVSSFDPEARFKAKETVQRLLKDGRINPVYIEKIYHEVNENFDQIMMDKWREALSILNLWMLHPDIVLMIGKFHLRYSYSQNLWSHSLEVAQLAEMLANEMWLDPVMAKKAWLLHDIWKVIVWNTQAHTKAGADLLRKYGFDDIVVNTAEGHHFDVELKSPIAWVVTCADAISASRPWARFNTKELYLERMQNLEKLIVWVFGVEKVYIMQAWREFMVFVNPNEVADIEVQHMIKRIWEKIEDQLDYPWNIRVVAIRETKVIDYLR